MAKFYCEYCGKEATSVSVLSLGHCPKHPDGSNKGRHKLYEGSEKSQYTCKYCGKKTSSLSGLSLGNCPKHPQGSNKGRHSPAL